jgi:hypothetical protein
METMMKHALGILVAVLVFSSPSAAQMAGLAVGARVRVTSPSDDLKKHVGTVMEVRGDSVVVSGRQGPRRVALVNITALDVSTGTRTRVMRSGLIGFGAGALVGAAVGAAAHEDCKEEYFCILPSSRGEDMALGALVFGSAGLLTGSVIGALTHTDRWEPRTSSVRVGMFRSPSGGVGLNLSRAF